MSPSPRQPILDRGRGTVGAGAYPSYSSNTSPNTHPRSGYCTSTRKFHSMRAQSCTSTRKFHSMHAQSFSSSDVPFVFPAFILFFLPNLLPPPTTHSIAQHHMSIWPFPYYGVDSVCFYHFYVPFTHPSVIAKNCCVVPLLFWLLVFCCAKD
jgi:hypothetical protein